jgi:hypothetical protein
MRIGVYDRCSSKGCEAVFAMVDWFPPSILPKTIINGTLMVLSGSTACHGIVVRRTVACKRHSNQSINQSINGNAS